MAHRELAALRRRPAAAAAAAAADSRGAGGGGAAATGGTVRGEADYGRPDGEAAAEAAAAQTEAVCL